MFYSISQILYILYMCVRVYATQHAACKYTCAYCRAHGGLFLCGEVLDVFGRIGGFNFYWAWLSGRAAGRGAAAAAAATAANVTPPPAAGRRRRR